MSWYLTNTNIELSFVLCPPSLCRKPVMSQITRPVNLQPIGPNICQAHWFCPYVGNWLAFNLYYKNKHFFFFMVDWPKKAVNTDYSGYLSICLYNKQ